MTADARTADAGTTDARTGDARARQALVALCFVLTGAFALAYEVVWARYLQLFIGHTTQAHTIVLGTFMGGQALGYVLFGRYADRAPRPIALYGVIEIAIGAYGVLFPSLYAAAGPAFLGAATGMEPGGAGLLAAKLVAGVLLVFPPAVLMGGTLPLLVRSRVAAGGDSGKAIARLYSINCAGAVLGTLMTAYVLLPEYGQTASMLLVGLANAVVGGIAILVAGPPIPSEAGAGAAAAGTPPADAPPPEVAPGRVGPALAIATLGAATTGFAAMVYEIGWFRLLAIVLGASTYSFSVMLVAFIGGIALGARIAGSDRFARAAPLRLFGLLQIGVGAAVALALPLYDLIPNAFRSSAVLLARTPNAFPLYQVVQIAICVLVMIVPTTLGGMSLPVVTRAIQALARGGVGRTVGRGFAANTTGTLLGAVAGGLFLLPALGIRHTFTAGILVNVIVGAAAILVTAPAAARTGEALVRARLVPLGLALAVGAAAFVPNLARGALTFQVFRRHDTLDGASFAVFHEASLQRGASIVFDEDGATATVTVLKQGDKRILFVNGKPDASSTGDMGIQLLLGHVPMLLKPDAKDVLVVGLGSGVSVGAVLRHPVTRVDVLEISPEVVRASRLFDDVSGAPLDDPRCRVIEEDARIALALAPRLYDAIVSEPSNPWVAGISSLFTVEHFRTVAAHLKPGGVAVQWFHLYENSDELVELIVRTFRSVFPHVRVFTDRLHGDLILAGSREPLEPDMDALVARLRAPEVARDLLKDGMGEPSTFFLCELFGPAEARLLSGPGPIHRDDLPTLEYNAPRALFVGDRALRYIRMADEPDRVVPRGDRLLERYLKGRPLTAREREDAASYLAGYGGSRGQDVAALYARASADFAEPGRSAGMRRMAGEELRRGQVDTAIELSAALVATSTPAASTVTAMDWHALVDALIQRDDRTYSRLAPPGYDEALAAAREISRRFPADAAIGRMGEGLCYIRRGETDAAEAAFAEVLAAERVPSDFKAVAAVRLARLRYARGDVDAALALCGRALELEPGYVDAARIYAALGGKRK